MAKEKLNLLDTDDIKRYQNGDIKFHELCEKYSVSVPTMYKCFNKLKIERRSCLVYKSINHSFFKHIDTEEKAYILGFYIADGCVVIDKKTNAHNFSITISLLDLEILEKIKMCICPNIRINYTEERINNFGIKTNTMCRLSFNSNELVNDLNNYGLGERKTYLKKTITNIVPESLMFHFIRGYFDGDGCISYSNTNKKHILRSGIETEYVNNRFKFGIISKDESILSEIKYFLETYSLKVNDSVNRGCNTIAISNISDIIKIYKLLYSDATIYMKRKYDKFNEILKYIDDGNNS